MSFSDFADILDEIYATYHHRRFVRPDPLQFLHDYPDPDDCEIVAMIASGLAYGRVAQILRSVETALDLLDRRPRRFLADHSPAQLRKTFAAFRHRFNTGEELAALLAGMKKVLRRHGTLQSCFVKHLHADHATTLPALEAFAAELHATVGGPWNHLLCNPAGNGACKRLHLMLRWLVRRDDVDPGPWAKVSPRLLLVPLDVHMHRLALAAARPAAARPTAAPPSKPPPTSPAWPPTTPSNTTSP